MRAVLLATIASIGMVGCVGQLDQPLPPGPSGSGTNPNPTGSNSQAKMMFEQNVYPLIHKPGAASDCSSCHTTGSPAGNITGFVATTVNDAYANLTSYQTVVGNFTPTAAGILSRISPTDVHVTTRMRAYTAAERQSITDWLAQEVVERGAGSGSGSGGETPGAATARVLNNWSACMTEANFTTAGMTTAWGQMQTNNGSRCESCHATGGQGMIVTEIQDSGTAGPGLWTVLSTNEYYLLQYFTVDLTGGSAAAKVIINTVSFNGVANAQPPHVEHPTFNATTNNGMTALKKFYDLTATSVTAGGCGATKLSPAAM